MKQKKILFTGISGVRKKEYLKKIFSSVPFSIEDKALRKKGEIPIWKELNNEKKIKLLKKTWEKAKDKNLITFHSAWWTPAGFVYDQFRMAKFIKNIIKPDYLIVLINNITDTRWYLQIKSERGDELAAQIGFRDIIIWRANEINTSLLLAQFIWPKDFKDHFYIVSTGHSNKTILDLIQTTKPRAYVAFPVRQFRQDLNEIDKIKKSFINIVERYCVVFNPLTIYEKEIENLLLNPDPERVAEVFSHEMFPKNNFFGEPFFPQDTKPNRFSLTLWEIAQVLRDINAQIVERDKLMVQQSDFVVAYRPLHSEGARKELLWSINFNRQAYAVVPEEDKDEWERFKKSLFGEEWKLINEVADLEALSKELEKVKHRGKKIEEI